MERTFADNKLAAFVYRKLLDLHPWKKQERKGRWYRRRWNAAWKWSLNRFSGPVYTNIHGKRVVVNFGHSYPLFARRFPHWNDPLLELVNQTHRSLGREISVIDVGAGIGDTALLIQSNCRGMVGAMLCIEGDPEFFAYLAQNLSQLENHKLCNVMLSDKTEDIASLVRHHAGTASASGTSRTGAVTLDALIADSSFGPVDLLKVDVDGFDGKVLGGARVTLKDHQPNVVFEWHPKLCRQTGNDLFDHFRILTDAGYRRFAWFTKYGEFSHFMSGFDESAVAQLAEICISDVRESDWHYDIVALAPRSTISDVDLAGLQFARHRRSWF